MSEPGTSSIPSISPGAGEPAAARPPVTPIPRWVLVVGLPVMVLVAVAAVWLLLGFGLDKDRLDAVRTGLGVGVGLGGGVVLWLSVRRQRSTEQDLVQKHETHRLAVRVAEHNEAVAADNRADQQQVAQAAQEDALERRITELYTKAGDQLGSDKAPVRLAGLYALERLAQGNKSQRQTIVNLICAYLRMPYTSPVVSRARPLGTRRKVGPGTLLGTFPALTPQLQSDAALQEREVRLTAQGILTAHLRPGPDFDDPVDTFWPDIDLDLTSATLINFNLRNCRIGNALFVGVAFSGNALFVGATFSEYIWFAGATFSRNALFSNATFSERAVFERVTFSGNAVFAGARFGGNAVFKGVTFARGIPQELGPFMPSAEENR